MSGLTFAVDDVVERASEPLPLELWSEELRFEESEKLLACSNPEQLLALRSERVPGLLGMVRRAFQDHRALILSPDIVWAAIAQGFATHIDANAEALRSRLVSHEGKRVLSVYGHWPIAEEAWPGLVDSFSSLIQREVGIELHGMICAPFSTTGPTERTVSEITLMGSFKHYFIYSVTVGRAFGLPREGGIPAVTLLGTPEDWRVVRRLAESLAGFDLGWWIEVLVPVLDQIVASAEGAPDREFWQSIYRAVGEPTGSNVTGWVNVLFPYVGDPELSPASFAPRPDSSRRSRWSFGGVPPYEYPLGISSAPVVIQGLELPVTLNGGFVGASQDNATLALKPELGWRVTMSEEPEDSFGRESV